MVGLASASGCAGEPGDDGDATGALLQNVRLVLHLETRFSDQTITPITSLPIVGATIGLQLSDGSDRWQGITNESGDLTDQYGDGNVGIRVPVGMYTVDMSPINTYDQDGSFSQNDMSFGMTHWLEIRTNDDLTNGQHTGIVKKGYYQPGSEWGVCQFQGQCAADLLGILYCDENSELQSFPCPDGQSCFVLGPNGQGYCDYNF